MSDDEFYMGNDDTGSDDSQPFEEDEDMVDGTQDSASDSSPDSEGDASDDDNFNVEIGNLNKAKTKSYDVEYESMSIKDVEEAMKRDAEQVTSIFDVDIATAYLLLRSMGWNKEKLMDKLMEDPEAVSKKAGVTTTVKTPSSSQVLSPKSPSSPTRRSSRKPLGSSSKPPSRQASMITYTCPICCETGPTETLSLGCSHAFCSECWQTYLHTKIRDEGECAVRCMEGDCIVQVPSKFIKRVCTSEDYERYENLVVQDFVSHNSHLRFCPLPGCTYTVSCASATKSSLSTVVPTVKCAEGHFFCFGCHMEGDHRPCVCAVAKLWVKKCQDDSETANWIKSNTKECPKCNSTIEKNGGCNHMTCKKCKHEYCWVCMGPWLEHGQQWYTCNRFDEKEAVDARDAQSKSRASLERYLHYYNRWANHEQSARLSLELYSRTEKKMEEMQLSSNLTWIEVQFAKKAVDEVIKCRTTLKWTYAMAYYLDKGNAKELFEDNQRDLEKAVEDLSELLESPIEAEGIPVLRQKMTDKTVYVAKRNEIMLEDTAKGHVDGRWTWTVDIE